VDDPDELDQRRRSTVKRLSLLGILTVFAVLAMGCPLHVTHYRDDDGSLVYVGDFYNTGDQALVGAAIEATLYDAGGTVIATKTDDLCQILPAKRILPFKVTLPPGTGDPARVEFKVVGTPTAEPYLATGLEASVVSEAKDDGGESWINGEIKNTSTNQYYTGYVCASWTNAAGDVLRTDSVATVGIRLPPGQSLPFVLVEEIPPEATGINFYLDAGMYPPGMEPMTVVTLPSTAFRNVFSGGILMGQGYGEFQLGEIYNTGAVKIGPPHLVAAARDSSGKLVAAGQWMQFCPAAVPPGSYTFGGYMMMTPSGLSGTTQLQIEARSQNVFPEVPVVVRLGNGPAETLLGHRVLPPNEDESNLGFSRE